jgi:hypothetical protein
VADRQIVDDGYSAACWRGAPHNRFRAQPVLDQENGQHPSYWPTTIFKNLLCQKRPGPELLAWQAHVGWLVA